MSGIAGIVRFDGAPVEAGQIASITSAMATRGPDGIQHWIAGSVGLGHCMLRTTPESHDEIQPLTNEDKSVVLVMDGRLDNRGELKQELRRRGIQVRSHTDTELVLGAYQLWGEDSPLHLLGAFAFAVWDARRHELFCARDHLGVKPFHYFSDEKFLAFASDEEAFLQIREVPREPNEDRIACVLVPELSGYDFDASWLKSIVKLPPGKTLSVRCGGQKITRTYWQLQNQDENRFASDLECEKAFRTVFSEAVRRRIRTCGNPALMLSGGIDSGSIAGAAHTILRQMPNKDLHTFSVVSDEVAACAETRNIQSVVKGYEQHANTVSVPCLDGPISLDDLKEAAWTNAHPVANAILLPAIMYLAASRAGHRVMLDGVGGDVATFTPIRYPSSLLRSGAWREAWAECRLASENNTYLWDESPLAILSKSAWEVFAPSSVKQLKRAVGGMVRERSAPSLINPDFARDIRLAEKLRSWRGRQSDGPCGDQDQHIRAVLPVSVPKATEGFDRVASRYSIEARHPWSDKTLIEFCVRLPLRYKARAGWTKYLVRKATAPWLDNGVRWHKGKDYLGRFLMRPLLDRSNFEMMSILGEAGGGVGQYVDTHRLNALIKRYSQQECDPDPFRTATTLYTAMSLGFWVKRIKAL